MKAKDIGILELVGQYSQNFDRILLEIYSHTRIWGEFWNFNIWHFDIEMCPSYLGFLYFLDTEEIIEWLRAFDALPKTLG